MRIPTAFAVLAMLLAAQSAPAWAQDQPTADQLNKLSLEALTATPPRGSGGGGYAPTPHRRYAPAASRGHAGRSSLGRATTRPAPRAAPAPRQRAASAPRRPSPYTPHFYRR